MEPRYDASQHEQEIYRRWEQSGTFEPRLSSGKSPTRRNQTFTIIMPPPNANDPLHIGHAMFVTLEDILIRFNRMRGKAALWLPGTDHAGIETQYVFEKKLAKEGKSRFDFDRDTLYRMIWNYVKENSQVAVNQMKRLGASADWSRLAFTLDQDITSQVIATFIQLHNKGLVYRDLRLVNYCTRCGTAFSELEVNHVERQTPLYYMKYGPFNLATVRPETKFGDTAVAVNPKDRRYKKYVGREIEVTGLLGTFKLKVIADDSVDMKFGTGVVKVTPYHDHNDFQMWQRHREEMPAPAQVIDFSGRLTARAGKYQGLKVAPARETVAADLSAAGLLEKVDNNYRHTIGVCYRCGTPLEPLPLPQFYIKVNDPKVSLTKMALAAINQKQINILGAGHDKILKHWLTNLRDWNISRQIVWGIQMPVWYCTKNFKFQISNFKINDKPPLGTHYIISQTRPTKCPDCGGKEFVQETDTFDTWFSSAQWPFATLMTAKPNDFKLFYPTDVMETAYDILPFWVMRMLMIGLFITGESPFHTVYFHGLIRDEKGQKMSKSKGNVINPLIMVDKYGADALRLALIIRSAPGLDKGVGENDIRGMRNLTNKIWNAARFIRMNSQLAPQSASPSPTATPQMLSGTAAARLPENAASRDQEFRQKLHQVVRAVTKQLESYRIGLAAETVYNEFWHWYCDECIEQAKRKELSYETLLHGLIVFLKLLHPFVPFVTETVWQELRNTRPELDKKMLITTDWPSSEDE